MQELTRADRQFIRGRLATLEKQPASKEIDLLERYFNGVGVAENSEYRRILEGLRGNSDRTEEVLSERELVIPPDLRAEYSGVYFDGKNHVPIRVNLKYGKFFLSRHYKTPHNVGGIKLSWEFKGNGEIYFVDLKELSSERISHLIRPADKKAYCFEWNPQLDLFMPIFSNCLLEPKLDLLLKFGYTAGRKMVEAGEHDKLIPEEERREKGYLKNSDKLFGNQQGLAKILDDTVSWQILQNIARRTPLFRIADGKGVISYSVS